MKRKQGSANIGRSRLKPAISRSAGVSSLMRRPNGAPPVSLAEVEKSLALSITNLVRDKIASSKTGHVRVLGMGLATSSPFDDITRVSPGKVIVTQIAFSKNASAGNIDKNKFDVACYWVRDGVPASVQAKNCAQVAGAVQPGGTGIIRLNANGMKKRGEITAAIQAGGGRRFRVDTHLNRITFEKNFPVRLIRGFGTISE